jgi:uncharacterized membrane protein HdeD (DUF308 family)
MDTSPEGNAYTGQTSQQYRGPVATAGAEYAKLWWIWLALGIVWIIAALVILQFRTASLVTVGVIVGIVLILAGIQEFFVAYVSSGWRWLWIALGVLLIIGGIWALIDPIGTFTALAESLGFLFMLIGIFWLIEAFATANMNPLWWLGLISGIIMVGLGFWAAGQFFYTKAYVLLVFAGIWLLLHGITDIVKAFEIRKVGTMVAGMPL